MDLVNSLGSNVVNSDWFDSIELIDNKVLVYVKEMNLGILQEIPQKIDNKHVFVHFLSSKNVSIDDYVNVEIIDNETSSDYQQLHSELSDMRKYCSYETILDIFYEVHDKDNSITNESKLYPFVKESMEMLYDKFGFDVIHDEISVRIDIGDID